MPPGCLPLWNVFLQLNASRGSNGMSPAAIGPVQVLAWQQLHHVELTPWEIETLGHLDRVALKHAEASQAEAPKG